MESQLRFNINYKNILLLLFLIIVGYIYYNSYLQKERETFQMDKLTEFGKALESYSKKRELRANPNLEKEQEEKERKKHAPIKPPKIKDSRILITGSTRGLGFELAKAVNKHKPILVVTGRTQKNVDAVVKELKKTNESVFGIAVDLSEKDGAKILYDKVYEKVGTVDILINNAFTSKGSRFLISKNHDDWTEEFFVNVNSSIVLSQKFAYRMKINKKKGRIINISSFSSKLSSTYTKSGSEILLKNMLEKFTNMLAEEVYEDKIAVATLRIDSNLSGSSNLFNGFLKTAKYTKYFNDLIGTQPKKIVPVVMYALTAPFHEISGKVISTKAFFENPKLSKIIPSHNIKLNKDIFKQVIYTKTIKRDDDSKIYLMKQNPYEMSPRMKKFFKKNKKPFNKFNTIAKYDYILDNVIAKKYKIKENNIVFFKSEYDMMKKLIDIFVPKYQEVVAVHTTWDILKLVCYENKVEIKFSLMNLKKNKFLEVNYDEILKRITSKTKMIYISTPNIISGQHLKDNKKLKNFLDYVPDNIVIVIDQRYVDFCTSDNKDNLDPIKYMKKENMVILRTFNNFYSIENLELSYIISSVDVAKFIRESQVINPIDKFTEEIALNVINDKYYDKTKQLIKKERERIYKILDENSINYLPSDTSYLLVETTDKRDAVEKQLEQRGLILYSSFDGYNNYWTLPLGDEETNNLILDTILYKG